MYEQAVVTADSCVIIVAVVGDNGDSCVSSGR